MAYGLVSFMGLFCIQFVQVGTGSIIQVTERRVVFLVRTVALT